MRTATDTKGVEVGDSCALVSLTSFLAIALRNEWFFSQPRHAAEVVELH